MFLSLITKFEVIDIYKYPPIISEIINDIIYTLLAIKERREYYVSISRLYERVVCECPYDTMIDIIVDITTFHNSFKTISLSIQLLWMLPLLLCEQLYMQSRESKTEFDFSGTFLKLFNDWKRGIYHPLFVPAGEDPIGILKKLSG
jgi:hypothetical protein